MNQMEMSKEGTCYFVIVTVNWPFVGGLWRSLGGKNCTQTEIARNMREGTIRVQCSVYTGVQQNLLPTTFRGSNLGFLKQNPQTKTLSHGRPHFYKG